jgi:hypothetical protein
MKVKGTGSPLSSGTEALEPLSVRDLQKSGLGDQFAASLAQLEAQSQQTSEASGTTNATRAALAEIAGGADFGSSEGVATAVRESARYMVRSRLHEKFRDTEQGAQMVSELGDYAATDPLIKAKLLAILQRIQSG